MANFLAVKINSDSITSAASVRPYRAALRHTILLSTGHDIGENPYIQKIMSAAENMMPSCPRYQDTWDMDILLRFWQQQPPNESLMDSDLLDKSITLLMAAAVLRSSDAKAIVRSSIRCSQEELSFVINNPKNAKGITAPVKVARMKDSTICPVAAIERYLHTTASRRASGDESLFVGIRQPFAPLSSKAIAARVVHVLKQAGIDTTVYKAHSVRSAAVSKAIEMGMDLDDVLVHGRWRSERVFRDFYERSKKGHHVSSSIFSHR